MYSRLFGVRFTMDLAVSPIAQNRVFSVGFSSYTQLPLYLSCASVPSARGKQSSRDRDRIAQDLLAVVHFHWRSPGGFPAPG